MSYDDVRRYRTDSLDDKEVAHADGSTHKIVPQPNSGLEVIKAGDKLIKCAMCKHRKVPFMPGYFCDICIKLWYMIGDEAQRVALDLWHREKDDKLQLTPLELERIHWITANKDVLAKHQVFCEYIYEEKPELVPELERYMRREVAQIRT